jgi:hypothetical protein
MREQVRSFILYRHAPPFVLRVFWLTCRLSHPPGVFCEDLLSAIISPYSERLPNTRNQPIAHFRSVIGIPGQFVVQHPIFNRRCKDSTWNPYHHHRDDGEQRIERQPAGDKGRYAMLGIVSNLSFPMPIKPIGWFKSYRAHIILLDHDSGTLRQSYHWLLVLTHVRIYQAVILRLVMYPNCVTFCQIQTLRFY